MAKSLPTMIALLALVACVSLATPAVARPSQPGRFRPWRRSASESVTAHSQPLPSSRTTSSLPRSRVPTTMTSANVVTEAAAARRPFRPWRRLSTPTKSSGQQHTSATDGDGKASTGSPTVATCKTIGHIFSQVVRQSAAACSLLDAFANEQNPASTEIERLFLRLVKRLGRPSMPSKPTPVVANRVDSATEVDHLQETLRLADTLKHITSEDLPALLSTEQNHLAMDSLSMHSYISVVRKLQRKGSRLSKHIMNLVSNTSPMLPESTATSHHAQHSPSIVRSHRTLTNYCSTMKALEVSMQNLLDDRC